MKMATPEQSSQFHDQSNTDCKPIGKMMNILRAFANGTHLHRFMAEHIGDHCLHSTVSSLQKKYSLKISRKRIKVPNRFGSKTSVCLYWLEGDDLDRARSITRLSEAIL